MRMSRSVFAVMIYVGTSGFSYPEWKGIVYPEDLPDRQYLSFYGQHFSSAEINNTFYRFPSAKTTQTWSEQVPDDFRFTLKMNRKVTHRKRLTDVEEEMDWFFNGASSLGGKLGTVLVQLPPLLSLQPGSARWIPGQACSAGPSSTGVSP